MTMQIKLSTQPAPSAWGEKAILSATESGMTVHLQAPSLQTIQKAARKIKNQGILDVSLAGDGWDLENCWAFHQGFNSVKQAGSVQYPDLAQEQAEFEARVECSIFTRHLINLPSDQLTPLELVKKAQHFLTEQAV